jgi:hypothetical protein
VNTGAGAGGTVSAANSLTTTEGMDSDGIDSECSLTMPSLSMKLTPGDRPPLIRPSMLSTVRGDGTYGGTGLPTARKNSERDV